MSRLEYRPIRVRAKPNYDRHRRIKKRKSIGGWIMGAYLPKIEKTWGEVFIAKRKAEEMFKFFNKTQ